MKTPFIIFALALLTINTFAQEESDYLTKQGYMSIEGEMIFSFASFETPEGVNIDQNMRWSPVFNMMWH